MEKKPSGEGKALYKEGKGDMLHPHTAKKSSGRMSSLEMVVVALLVLGLLGIGRAVYKAIPGSKSDA